MKELSATDHRRDPSSRLTNRRIVDPSTRNTFVQPTEALADTLRDELEVCLALLLLDNDEEILGGSGSNARPGCPTTSTASQPTSNIGVKIEDPADSRALSGATAQQPCCKLCGTLVEHTRGDAERRGRLDSLTLRARKSRIWRWGRVIAGLLLLWMMVTGSIYNFPLLAPLCDVPGINIVCEPPLRTRLTQYGFDYALQVDYPSLVAIQVVAATQVFEDAVGALSLGPHLSKLQLATSELDTVFSIMAERWKNFREVQSVLKTFMTDLRDVEPLFFKLRGRAGSNPSFIDSNNAHDFDAIQTTARVLERAGLRDRLYEEFERVDDAMLRWFLKSIRATRKNFQETHDLILSILDLLHAQTRSLRKIKKLLVESKVIEPNDESDGSVLPRIYMKLNEENPGRVWTYDTTLKRLERGVMHRDHAVQRLPVMLLTLQSAIQQLSVLEEKSLRPPASGEVISPQSHLDSLEMSQDAMNQLVKKMEKVHKLVTEEVF